MKAPYRINTRLFLSIAILILCSGLASIVIINWQMKKYAQSQAGEEASIILNRNLAIHTYFSHQLKPALFKKLDSMNMPGYFDPVWMSSTYAVREIDQYFRSITNKNYYYKECAINARNPENEADAFEKSFIKKLNDNPDVKELTTIREFEGKRFLVVLKRGEVMEESCLRCHSNPGKAPADMVKLYGPSRSFNRSPNEVVSAISIRIPVEDAFAGINMLSIYLALTLFLILAGLFGSITRLTKYMIFDPLENIREKANKIAKQPEYLGEQIEYPDGIELFDLVKLLNEASSKLSKERNLLESRVKKRTEELKHINEKLEQKIKEAEEEINKRKLAEEELQSSKDQYQRLVEELSDHFLIYSYTPDGTLLYTSRGIKTIFGISPEQAVGKNLFYNFDNIPNWIPEEYELAKKKFADLLAGHEIKGIEISFIHTDGTQRTIIDTPHIIRDSNGNIKFIEGIAEEITERKQMENELRNVKEQYQRLVEEIGNQYMIYSYETNGTILYVSPGIKSMFGVSAEEAVGKNIFMSKTNWIGNDFEHAKERFNSILSGIEVEASEMTFTHPDGSLRTILDRPHFIQDINGSVVLIEGIVEDITERKQVENALKESEKRYRALIEKMTLGFALHELICNKDGKPVDFRFLEVNPAFEKTTGIRANKLIGKTVLEAFPQTESYWVDTYGRVTLTGKPVHFETYIKEIDRYYDVVAYSPQEGQFATLVSNITKKKKIENDRERLIKELQEALENIKTLKGLLPICSECKKIRDDKGYWNQIEFYFKEHSEVEFSHSLCPNCTERLYGKEDWYKKMKEDKNI